MSIITARTVRGRRGHRLGNLGFSLIQQPITATSVTPEPTPAVRFVMPDMGGPSILGAGAFNLPQPELAERFGAPPPVVASDVAPEPSPQVTLFIPAFSPTQPVVDTTGEVVSETTSPGSGMNAEATPYISDVSPAVVPQREAWKTWLPIGLVVVGIAGAVWVLRRK